MDPSSGSDDDIEFWLPSEFITDEDILVENGEEIFDDSNKCLIPNEYLEDFGSTLTPNVRFTEKEVDDENLLGGWTKQMFPSSLEDDFSRGFYRNHAYPIINDDKAWGMTRSPICADGNDCFCRNQRSNQNFQSQISSQASWDLYCAAVAKVARMNINDYNNHCSGRGLLSAPRKVSSVASAVKNPNNGSSGYFNQHLPLLYQKLQAIHHLNQQQRMKHYRQLVQQSRGLRANSNKNVGPVDLLTSVWSNNQLPRRDGSGMRALFLGKDSRKRGSTGTGVFLPHHINHTSGVESREKPALSMVLVPARVAQALNLNLDEPVRSLASLNGASWRPRSNNGGFSSQMVGGVRVEQPVNEPRLPSD